MAQIRTARSSDVEGIGGVVEDVWEQSILPDVCEAQIEGDASVLLVAEQNSHVLGFASAFLTVGQVGDRRWEVDLVGVRSASQGQGLGTELIRQVYDAGEAHGVSLTRALIRVENVASQRAFETIGFRTSGQEHRLFLWSPAPPSDSTPVRDLSFRGASRRGTSRGRRCSLLRGRKIPPLHLTALCSGPNDRCFLHREWRVSARDSLSRETRHSGPVLILPVDTLTYRGLWIERLASVSAEEQHRAVEVARSLIARDGRLNAGAVIRDDEVPLLARDLRDHAEMHGEYYWFIK